VQHRADLRRRSVPDGAPLAEGDISGLADGTLYLGLHEYAQRFGPVYKLCFGPKSFIVTSDHRCARHILSLQNRLYNKGVLRRFWRTSWVKV